MHRSGSTPFPWRDALLGAVLCVIAGMVFLRLPVPANWSYDLAVMLKPRAVTPDGIVIVYMDEKSFRDLGQKPGSWDRALYAGLIDRLSRDQARLVVLDVFLSDRGVPSANDQLIRALRASGRTVLASRFAPEEKADAFVRTLEPPLPEFAEAAKGSGVSEVVIEGSDVVRQYFQGDDRERSLPWVAATLLDEAFARRAGEGPGERWLNYYGPPGALRNVSFSEATNQPPGYFKDQCVFIGSWRKAYYAYDHTDEFVTPGTRGHGKMSGVEITATAFLNLLRGEYWSRMAAGKEQSLIALAGLLFGFGLCLARPGLAGMLGVVAMVFFAALGMLYTWETRMWGAWTVPVGAQIPLAIAWSCLAHTWRLRREKESLEKELTRATEGRVDGDAADRAGDGQTVPDHVLICRIGAGGYGEVWLARNTVGLLHAVKIVHRRAFTSDVPYEREFRGIERFMPVSRSHPGLVHILHVGRNDVVKCFYYVMEPADTVSTQEGTRNPESPRDQSGVRPQFYQPRTLAFDLEQRGALPPVECARLGVALASALEHLHQRQLIHRDIKPANIIYVDRAPKLADIGLVTSISGQRDDTVSHVGTDGYIAPEGPGTAAADVYGLGKVLYESCTGQDRRKFPELPTTVYDAADYRQRMALNEIIVKACATKVEERYQSAAELREDLEKLLTTMDGI